jgi:hypothetical protein
MLRSVRLESSGSVSSVVSHVVNVRTSPLRKRTPKRLTAGKLSHFAHTRRVAHRSTGAVGEVQ